jgi:hypothetical protein
MNPIISQTIDTIAHISIFAWLVVLTMEIVEIWKKRVELHCGLQDDILNVAKTVRMTSEAIAVLHKRIEKLEAKK